MILAALAAAAAIQSAGDVQAACKAFQTEHGGDVDCVCLGKLVANDDDLLAELMTITEPADLEEASNEMKLTLKACEE